MSKYNKEKAKKFFENPDIASRAKTRLVSYYMSLYFNIIRNTVKGRIHYLDFFSGPGLYGDGTLTVPLNVLKCTKDLYDIDYYFNDLNLIDELKQNIQSSGLGDMLCKCKFTEEDCSTADMENYIPKSGALISYVDSFSHLLTNTSFVKKLIEPRYSDCVIFINFSNIIKRYKIEEEKKHFLVFFGSLENFEKMKREVLSNENIVWDKKVQILLKDYLDRLTKCVGSKLYSLPIFFKATEEDTNTNNVILIISKNITGIDRIRKSFSPSGYNQCDDTLKNSYFNIRKSSFVVYENNIRQVQLFDFDEMYYEEILKYIEIGKDNAVTRDDLCKYIDETFLKKNSYCCAFSEKYINKALKSLENEGKIKTYYIGTRKRPKGTFGKDVFIYREA